MLVVEQLRRRVPGGIGTYARGLVRGLVELAAPPAPPPAPPAPPAGPPAPPAVGSLELLASRPKRLDAGCGSDPLAGLGLPLRTTWLGPRALAAAWDHGLAPVRASRVVHACSLAAPPTTAALVVTVHDLAWRHEPDASRRRRAWHEAALSRAGEHAAGFVVPSQQVRDALVEARACRSAERVRVIEEGADHLEAPDHDGATALLAELGVGGHFLLSVGTLEPRKNLATLYRAYEVVRPSLPEAWPLVVVGPAGWGPGAPPPEGVRLAGRVGAGVLAALYSRARCLCYVPLEEGFGLPVVEAMACGAPVVSSPVPSAGGASMLADPRDAESIAAAILSVATDEDLRARLVAAGAARVAPLTWRAAAAAHWTWWSELSGGSP